jgi:hypothetical protein
MSDYLSRATWHPGPLMGGDGGLHEIKQALWRLELAFAVLQESVLQQINQLKTTQSQETATIASGAVSLPLLGGPSVRVLIVDTEGAAALDELNTINNTRASDIVIVKAANAARTVRLTENGNLKVGEPIPTFDLLDTVDAATFVSDGTNLYAMALRNN